MNLLILRDVLKFKVFMESLLEVFRRSWRGTKRRFGKSLILDNPVFRQVLMQHICSTVGLLEAIVFHFLF